MQYPKTAKTQTRQMAFGRSTGATSAARESPSLHVLAQAEQLHPQPENLTDPIGPSYTAPGAIQPESYTLDGLYKSQTLNPTP